MTDEAVGGQVESDNVLHEDVAIKEKIYDEYLFIFRVLLKGKRTSISLDNVIVKLLTARLGSKEAVAKWLQASMDEISKDFPNEKPAAGYSRIVQQKAILTIADPLLLPNLFKP